MWLDDLRKPSDKTDKLTYLHRSPCLPDHTPQWTVTQVHTILKALEVWVNLHDDPPRPRPHTSPETRSGVVVAVGRACTLQGRLFPPTGNTHCRQTDLSLPLPLCARAAEQYCPQHGVYVRCQAASLSEDSKILCKCKHRDFRSSGRILCVCVHMCVREFRM